MKKRLILPAGTVEYELERKRVKNLNLRIDREGNIRVSAPRFVPQKTVEAFIAANAGRILQSRERLVKRAELMSDRENSLILCGRRVPLRTERGGRNAIALSGGELVITLRNTGDGARRRSLVQALLRETAQTRVRNCCERVYPVFVAMGVGQPELSFRSMKRTWGSCRPSEGRLCFNTALARVPEECVEYVVYHEFCHFIHPNHSPAFHALMTRLLPDWKQRKTQLEKYAPLMGA